MSDDNGVVWTFLTFFMLLEFSDKSLVFFKSIFKEAKNKTRNGFFSSKRFHKIVLPVA